MGNWKGALSEKPKKEKEKKAWKRSTFKREVPLYMTLFSFVLFLPIWPYLSECLSHEVSKRALAMQRQKEEEDYFKAFAPHSSPSLFSWGTKSLPSTKNHAIFRYKVAQQLNPCRGHIFSLFPNFELISTLLSIIHWTSYKPLLQQRCLIGRDLWLDLML